MEAHSLRTVVGRLREVVAPPGAADADLVRAFARRRDHSAFEAIVRRHGPMVLGACRRVLRDSIDADDAFQATFLVLFRRAGSLRQPDRLAGWLHAVAHRTARKLRAMRLARQAREAELFDLPAGETPAEFIWRELRPIFDQELDRLPEKLRLPAVLCFLEGHSKGQAARTLGWPEGTLAGRLQQARERLRLRFAARGLTLSAGALATALFEGVGSAAVPELLLTTTLQIATTGPASATASAAAWALADGVNQAMFMTKAKALAAAVLIAGMVGTGTGVVLVPGSGPGEVVAADPPKEATPKKVQAYDVKEARKQIEQARISQVLHELDMRHLRQRSENDRDKLVDIVKRHVDSLRAEIERMTPQVTAGWVKQSELDQLKTELRDTEAELAKLVSGPAKDPERELLEADLFQLKERALWEERMIKKGFMTETQLNKTKAEIARAGAALKKLDAPKVPDPRRAALEELIRKSEEIVQRTKEGVAKGIVSQTELLNAERSVLEYKLKLAELPVPPLAVPAEAAPDPVVVNDVHSLLGAKERELARAEALFKQNVISAEEVRRLRIDLGRLRAQAGEATGDYAAALKAREGVVAEWETILAEARRLVTRDVVSKSELQGVEVALSEAKVEALGAAARKELAAVVEIRTRQVQDAKTLFNAKAISAEELRQAEQALEVARKRLAAHRW